MGAVAGGCLDDVREGRGFAKSHAEKLKVIMKCDVAGEHGIINNRSTSKFIKSD